MTALAPMVRLGTLPLRLMALERGASLVYTEEIVDSKLAAATRHVDDRLGTVDWRGPGGGLVLRIGRAERGRVVVQLGTASPESAFAAIAALGEAPHADGIAGIDLNMGCPKTSATSGGSGSALFADAARAEDVVRALRAALPPVLPLSCKVRLCVEGPGATIERCSRLVAAGASAIAVHARRVSERSCDLARWDELKQVAAGLDCAVLLNGDVLDASALAELQAAVPGCMVMVGRGALSAGNGVFGDAETEEASTAAAEVEDEELREARLERATLAQCVRYAQLAIDVENAPLNTCFVLRWMLHVRMRERRAPPPASAAAFTAISTVAASTAAASTAATSTAAASATAASTAAASTAAASTADAPSECSAAASLVDRADRALRGCTSLPAIAAALDLSAYYDSRPRNAPAPPTHRYTPDYFDHLDKMSDWARSPSRATVAEARAAMAAPIADNDAFRRLVLARAAMAPCAPPSTAGSTSRDAAPPAAAEDHRQALVAAVGPALPVKYFVLEESAATAKSLGYFAMAWRCRAVVAGRSFDGEFKKSRHLAEQDAARLAVLGLAGLSLAKYRRTMLARARNKAAKQTKKARLS